MDREPHDHGTLKDLPEEWILTVDYLHEIRTLIQENQVLLQENRDLLKEIRDQGVKGKK